MRGVKNNQNLVHLVIERPVREMMRQVPIYCLQLQKLNLCDPNKRDVQGFVIIEEDSNLEKNP